MAYKKPAYDLKTTGVYKFKTKDKEYILKVTYFERESDTQDSLAIQDDLRGELGSINIKNASWNKLSKGETIRAVSSKGDTGMLTRIDDIKSFEKYANGGGVDNGNKVTIDKIEKIVSSKNGNYLTISQYDEVKRLMLSNKYDLFNNEENWKNLPSNLTELIEDSEMYYGFTENEIKKFLKKVNSLGYTFNYVDVATKNNGEFSHTFKPYALRKIEYAKGGGVGIDNFFVKSNFGHWSIIDRKTNKMVVGYSKKEDATITAKGLNDVSDASELNKIISKLKSMDGYGYFLNKMAKGGTLSKSQLKHFKEWMEDGNVSKNNDGTYSTQDAQFRNKLKNLNELKKYFKKEFAVDDYADDIIDLPNKVSIKEEIDLDDVIEINNLSYEVIGVNRKAKIVRVKNFSSGDLKEISFDEYYKYLEKSNKYNTMAKGGVLIKNNTNLPKVGSEVNARWNNSMQWTNGIFKGETENGFEVYDFSIEQPRYIEYYGQISLDPYNGSEIFKSNKFKDRNYKNYHFNKQDTEYEHGGSMGSNNKNGKYLDNISSDKKSKILKNIASHYGFSVGDAEAEVRDADAEMLYEYIANDQSLRMDVYNDMKRDMMAKGGGINKQVYTYTDKNLEGRYATRFIRSAGENGLSKYVERLSNTKVKITVPSDKKESEELLEIVEFSIGRNNLVPFHSHGGSIEDENREMVLNENNQIIHHTKELPSAIKGKRVPAWVVTKVHESASDLSDATHYMDGQKMAKGGNVKYVDTKFSQNNSGVPYFLEFKDAVGSFAWKYGKYNEGILYNLSDFDKDYYSHLPLKMGEKLFRYSTDIMIGDSKYLIKINLDKGLIYFMSEENDRNDDKNISFETKGIKSEYITLDKDKVSNGGKMANGGSLVGTKVKVSFRKEIGVVKDYDNDWATVYYPDLGFSEKVNLKSENVTIVGEMEKGGGVSEDNKFNYMMLGRLQTDCDYYLGNGNRSEKVLWAGNVDDHIEEMKKIWNNLPKDGKPEWLSMEDIKNYENKMKNNKMENNKMAKGGKVGKAKSYLHLYKLTSPNGQYRVEAYDGEAMTPKEALEKMRISLRGLKSYKYSGASSDSENYKKWYDKKDIGYSDTEAWDEVFGSQKYAKGGGIYSETMKTADGDIVGEVRYNDQYKTYQVVIDGVIYEEFKSKAEAIENLKNAGFGKAETKYKKGDSVMMFEDEPALIITEVYEFADKGNTYDLASEDGKIKRGNISHTKLSPYKMAKGGSISDIGFENSNLYLYGFGIDNNGNSIVKVGFPNQRAFSIQTNGVLRNTHNLNRTKLSELSSGDIASIENEVVDYVKNYGSITQKKSLKIYGNKMAKGGGVGKEMLKRGELIIDGKKTTIFEVVKSVNILYKGKLLRNEELLKYPKSKGDEYHLSDLIFKSKEDALAKFNERINKIKSRDGYEVIDKMADGGSVGSTKKFQEDDFVIGIAKDKYYGDKGQIFGYTDQTGNQIAKGLVVVRMLDNSGLKYIQETSLDFYNPKGVPLSEKNKKRLKELFPNEPLHLPKYQEDMEIGKMAKGGGVGEKGGDFEIKNGYVHISKGDILTLKETNPPIIGLKLTFDELFALQRGKATVEIEEKYKDGKTRKTLPSGTKVKINYIIGTSNYGFNIHATTEDGYIIVEPKWNFVENSLAPKGLWKVEKENKFADGGEVSDAENKQLWYVTDVNDNVKNISTSIPNAQTFLSRIGNNGSINYVKVPLSDWNAEKVNVSNIKQYAKKMWQSYEKGGKLNLNTYKLRAEGLNDFLSFLQNDMYMRVKSFTIEPIGFPDVVVSFVTDASLSEIKSKLKEVQDSHVMLETVKPINEYTGERYEDGGSMDSQHGIDLFEDNENIPANVQSVLDNHEDAFIDGDYKELQKALTQLKKIGYTFEFDLDGQAYDLRPIGTKGKSEMEEYEEGTEAFKQGGNVESSVTKLNKLGIRTSNEFGDEFRDFLDRLEENNDGEYIGYRLDLPNNELTLIQEKATKTVSILDYSEFPKNGTWRIEKHSIIHYKDGGSINAKSIFKEYEENENDNYHAENILLLANNFGTEEDVETAKEILKQRDKQGSTSEAMNKKSYELNKRLYPKLIDALNSNKNQTTMTQEHIDKFVRGANSTDETAREISTRKLKEAGLDKNGKPLESKKEVAKSKISAKKETPVKSTPQKEDDYDCDEIIAEALKRKKNAKKSAEKSANKPEVVKATKKVERTHDAIEKQIEAGKLKKAQIEKIIAETEDLLKMLKKALKSL